MDCFDCIRKSTCFSNLEESDFDKIKSDKLDLFFKKGETIFKQGAYASNILLLNKGTVKTYLESPGDKKSIISVLPEGELIGLPSLFSSRVYPYSATAMEDCQACSLDIRLIEELILSNGQFAGTLIKCLNDSTIQRYERYIFNTQRSLKGRLADVLIHLSEKIYNSPEFTMGLTRNDLAEWTQMAPESVTRLLSTFSKEGFITVKNKNVRIDDMEGLRLISNEL